MGLGLLVVGCGGAPEAGRARITFPASTLGAEAELLRRQVARFEALHPELRVELRPTPDSADRRHQLFVQWLAAWAPDPDVLQLDVVWVPEFAAAGWVAPLPEPLASDSDLLPEALRSASWRGRPFAVPWFVDVGLLYWRTDLLREVPHTISALHRRAVELRERAGLRYGLVWQGARYEGLVTVFVEYLGACGGRVLDDAGRVVLDGPGGLCAFRLLRDALDSGAVPAEALAWREEPVRLAFQAGQAVFMRNWPYAAPLLRDRASSRVADRFAVATLPRERPEGRPTAALGGASLAVNARSDVRDAAFEFVAFLTAPEQMAERARALGHLPPRPSLYRGARLSGAFDAPPEVILGRIRAARSRPVTPLYSELSRALQTHLHRMLSGQVAPEAALRAASRELRAILHRAGLEPGAPGKPRGG